VLCDKEKGGGEIENLETRDWKLETGDLGMNKEEAIL
jgi:hypothetical protein